MYGARIRALRKQRGWTMKQLGQRMELAESTISGYENKIRRPDLDTLIRFAELFDVSVDYLLGRSNVVSGEERAAVAREERTEYRAAYWDGKIETLTEEEAAHLKNSLEMFRVWKASRSLKR